MTEKFSFSVALDLLKDGKFVANAEWIKGSHLGLQVETAFGRCRRHILISTYTGLEPWSPLHRELLSEDWFEVIGDAA